MEAEKKHECSWEEIDLYSEGRGNVMTWFDERDEQTQGQWRSRLEKGRLDLSASVEQTLAEGAADEAEEVWMDVDGEEGGTQVVDEHMGEVHRGTAVIPPRLSLQTKPMYTVATAAHSSEVPVPAVGSSEMQEHSQQKQPTGVFSRLAQRITMSLAAITSPFQAQGAASQPAVQEMHVPMSSILPPTNLSMQTVTTVRVERSETTTTIIEGAPMHYPVPAAAHSPTSSVPRLPRPDHPVQGEGKARPAGYPSRVHLEATPKDISPHSTVDTSEKYAVVSYPAHDSTEPLPLRNTFSAIPRSAPTLELPAVNAVSTDAMAATRADQSALHTINRALMEEAPTVEAVYDKTTSGRMPSVHVPTRESDKVASLSLSRTTFGSGSFDAGQGEVAVASPEITGSSVVTVMLASDPGPVVVQYVSLQPGTGFTIHLSAPTKVKTLFNYVVLRGES